MADSRGVESGREPTGSQTSDAGNPALARGAAGTETGAGAGAGAGAAGDKHGDLESRRETEQVLRSTSDGMGEGLTKDHS